MARLKCSMMLVVGLSIAAMASVACATVMTETFDSDPDWTGHHNTDQAVNSYGLSNTNNAGGGTGEIGGMFSARTLGNTWYANQNLGGVFSMSDTVTISGRFILNDPSQDGWGTAIGFFNSNDPNHGSGGTYAMPSQMVGMRLMDNGSSATTFRVTPVCGTGANSPITLTSQAQYLFEAVYDPAGGGVGVGKTTLTIRNTAGDIVATESNTQDTVGGWSINSFGVVTMNATSDYAWGEHIYFDNLSHSVVPEPTSLVVLATGMADLLAYAWRKRR